MSSLAFVGRCYIACMSAKRVRVACACGWKGQRALPSGCPKCEAPLAPAAGKPGRKPGTRTSDRERVSLRLRGATIAYLGARGNVATEAARRVEESVEREQEAAAETRRRAGDRPGRWAEEHAFDDDGP